MSRNQSRPERSETAQYRRTGRSSSFGQQRGSAGSTGSGKGGAAGPPPISSSASGRSFKKSNNNAQGGHARVGGSGLITESSTAPVVPRSVQNGAYGQPPLHGPPDVPHPSAAARPTDSSIQKSTQPDPKATSSSGALACSDKILPTTPAKGDGSKGMHFQFGSLSPGLVNGMQIPARTSSAPPNLDEQKRDQARHEAYRAALPVPIPSVPKQSLPRKDTGSVDRPSAVETFPFSNPKKETKVSSVPSATQTQKPSVHSMSGISMQMPFHQPQVSVQFGVPNTQIQPPGMTVPTAMPLPIGSAPQVQQQMFFPSLQHHPIPPQGIMPQGQGIGFTAQMGPQLGTGTTPQNHQQQGGVFGGARKPVKITDPKTHEELRLDRRAEAYSDSGSSGLRSLPNPSQSQPIPTFSSGHPVNYYTNSYNPGLFFPTSSLSLTGTQVAPSSQAPRFNYPVSQASPTMPYMSSPALSSLPSNKSGNLIHGISESSTLPPAIASSVPSNAMQVTLKPPTVSSVETVGYSPTSISPPAAEKYDLHKLPKTSGENSLISPQRGYENYSESPQQQLRPLHGETLAPKSLPVVSKQTAPALVSISLETPASNAASSAPHALPEKSPAVVNSEFIRKESLSRSNSIKDNQKPVEKLDQTQYQVGELSTPISSIPSPAIEPGVYAKSGVSKSMDAKSTTASIKSIEVMLESSEQSTVHTAIPKSKTDRAGSDYKLSEVSGAGNGETVKTVHYIRQDRFAQDEHLICSTTGVTEQKDAKLLEGHRDDKACKLSSDSISSKSLENSKQIEKDPVLNITIISNDAGSLETVREEMEKPVECHNNDRLDSNLIVPASKTADSINTETDPSNPVSSAVYDADRKSSSDASVCRKNSTCSKAVVDLKPSITDHDSVTVLAASLSEATLKNEVDSSESISSDQVPFPVSTSKDKPAPELSRPKSSSTKAKKKRNEILQRADAAGTSSDLYVAYKGPEEKKEPPVSSESMEVDSSTERKSTSVAQEGAMASDGGEQIKAEPDDWEDAADISRPKLDASKVHGVINHNEDGHGVLAKKYSRDFLLKFADQYTLLPHNFDAKPDLKPMMDVNVNISHLTERDSSPNPGRIADRPSGGSRRGSGLVDDDKWTKSQGAFASGRDLRLDFGYGGNVLGSRPGQGSNYGVLRNPRAQSPIHYAGGILTAPMQPVGHQGGMQRNGPDADRWQRTQKGLFPSPQTPLQVMHKAEKKYEVGKVADEEQAKQRQLKAILNKLTPQNFEKLFEQVKTVNIDNAGTLKGVISQIFDKALMEPTFCEMYANFCSRLAVDLPDFSEDDKKITFKRLLLNKCQEEFERGVREQEEADRVEEEGEIKQTKEEREEKRMKARRRMLGNIRLIGELYKKRMLTERIMHECIKKLLGQHETPDEEDIESLCKLMSTIGEMIDHPKAKEFMDAYFERMADLSNNMKLSSRVRFMLKDSIDLRKNRWQQRRKVEGPKKIDEVHRDAAQERQGQVSRLARGASMNPSAGRPVDFGPRGSNMIPSPNAQVGGYRGRGFGTQDARLNERHLYEGRPVSVPLSQRPTADDSITLGPQGGLAKGMSSRGQTSICTPLPNISPSSGDTRRIVPGLNGYSSTPAQTGYSAREDGIPKYMPERYAHDQLNVQERNMPFGSREIGNPDCSLGRSLPISPPTQVLGSVTRHNVVLEKVWTEEHLQDLSITTIREFYSAKDEKEVALCIKDLNSPGFYPSMISLWVTDSFERKDAERDLLATLLVNLIKPKDAILSQSQLIKGFETVLTTLEDAVNDAPKAAEFLGRIFAKVILEGVISLGELGRLVYDGGEEPGNLREVGLAAEILGATLEMIKSEKGDSTLNEIRSSSNLRLEDFRHPDTHRSRKLQLFI